MKKLHLICNAHIDPVWLWDINEGLTTAMSTFYSAAQLAEEFDYIFCHNESVIYEFIEKHDPQLFAKIRDLVKRGKWHIMGGWYLQPDCNMPSGESLVRQILTGRRYFKEKFGVQPTTAINLDPFGHSRGLVQILKKCGYDSYLVCRPEEQYLALPDRYFLWEGFDGSRIKVCRIDDQHLYRSMLGKALENIRVKTERWQDYEVGAAMWGVGNHGGGPSRKDLADIREFIAEEKIEILHSTPEMFMADLCPEKVFSDALNPFARGCYSSMSRLKRKHIELENKLFITEKLCVSADLAGHKAYPHEILADAQKKLLLLQFHDILCGTCTQEGEQSMITAADAALQELGDAFLERFLAFVSLQSAAEPGTYPVFAFNPHPYCLDTVLEAEFQTDNLPEEEMDFFNLVEVRSGGRKLTSQAVKEYANINDERRKRVLFRAELKPFSIERYDFYVTKTRRAAAPERDAGDIVVKDKLKEVRISRRTGLLSGYKVAGREYLAGEAFLPVAYDDSPDSWGFCLQECGMENPVPFTLLSSGQSVFGAAENVNVIEDGEIVCEVESFFTKDDSKIRIDYRLYKDVPYIDVKVEVYWMEHRKALKLIVPVSGEGGFSAQTAYGTQEYAADGKECVVQRFVAAGDEDAEKRLVIANDCIYSAAMDGRNLQLTLLRGAAYCAHPLPGWPLVKDDRYIPSIEAGKHEFRFRMGTPSGKDAEAFAAEFTEKPYTLNVFPHGKGEMKMPLAEIDSARIRMTSFYKNEDGVYVMRLFNGCENEETCTVRLESVQKTLHFSKYEIKTLCYDGGNLTESQYML